MMTPPFFSITPQKKLTHFLSNLKKLDKKVTIFKYFQASEQLSILGIFFKEFYEIPK